VSEKEFVGEDWLATPRADTWIACTSGGFCRERRLTMRRLLADIALLVQIGMTAWQKS
jgi:hypothetical protein